MTRTWNSLAVIGLVSGSLLLAAGAAEPPAAKSRPDRSQPAEPTPVDEVPPAAPETNEQVKVVPKSEQAEDQGPWEVTERVELIFRDPISVKSDRTLSAKVILKNKSEEALNGKLVLVIDGTSLPGTKLAEPQGEFTQETPYVQMVPAKRKLEPGDQTAVKTIILSSKEALTDAKAEDVKLRWRAFTLTKPADLNFDPPEDKAKVPGKGYTWGEMRRVMAIQDAAAANYLGRVNGVVGIGTSEDENGNLVIRFCASRGGLSRVLPGSIDGIPVVVSVTGNITAGPTLSAVTHVDGQAQKVVPTSANSESQKASSQIAQSGPPTKTFIRPIPIGVSGINLNESACATGTLGCRCRGKDGTLYILSNNHVLARENAGVKGVDPIVQPGPLDNACVLDPTDSVGTLTDFQQISLFTGTTQAALNAAPVNLMDAAIAVTPIGQVDVQTPSDGYGVPSRFPQENLYPGMAVMKYGRTTALTKGNIVALNNELIVGYTGGSGRFKNCINTHTAVRQPRFSSGGDSGSLVVTQADRRPIALHFAGGTFDSFSQPISPILHRFKVGIDDGTGAAPVLGSGRMGSASGPVKQFKNVILQ